jgi:DNA-binding MarR family transcriptional regulator
MPDTNSHQPSSTLHAELQLRRPFMGTGEEALLSVYRTAEVLLRGTMELLRPYGLTATQYNVLRILRGRGPEGLPCSEIGARMVTHEPDVTRLLDRLQRMGYVERERATTDRRVVLTHITEAGLELLARIDAPITELDERRLGVLSEEELRALIALLEKVRGAAAAACSDRGAPERDGPDAG